MKRLFTVLLVLVVILSTLARLPVRSYGTEMNYHNEVIVMVDGSYSTEEYWDFVRNGIVKIGKNVLDDSTLMTVMAFGTADNIVLQHVKNVKELEKSLSKKPETILYGRSMTNCEAGFTGVMEYINNHDSNLGKVYVVFLTDGEINMDETEYAFNKWEQNDWLKKDAVTLAKWSVEEEVNSHNENNTNLSDAYKMTFGEENKEIQEDKQVLVWANLVWNYVYAYSGMTMDKEYAISDVERAFVRYDKEHNTHVREIFYYTTWGKKYPNAQSRTYSAGIALANNSKVTHLYMIDVNETSAWMEDMEKNLNKVFFEEAGSVSNLVNILDKIVANVNFEKNEPTKPLEPKETTVPETVATEPTIAKKEHIEDSTSPNVGDHIDVAVLIMVGSGGLLLWLIIKRKRMK